MSDPLQAYLVCGGKYHDVGFADEEWSDDNPRLGCARRRSPPEGAEHR